MAGCALLVSGITPRPTDNGRRAFLNGLLEYLVDRWGEDNVHFGFVAHDNVPTPGVPCHVHRLPIPSPPRKLLNAGISFLTRQLSLQEAMFSFPGLRSAVADLVERYQPEVEIYDTLRMGQFRAPGRPGARQVLHLDDLYSVRYARMLDTAATHGVEFDPLGEFAGNVPSPFRPLAQRPAVYRRLLAFEGRVLAERERSLVHEFAVSTLVNRHEVDDLTVNSGCPSVREIRPLAPTPGPLPRAIADPPEYVFLGRLNVPHNDDAIVTFIREGLPALLALRPDARLRVVGNGASPALTRVAAEYPGTVVLEGFVEDLDEVLSRASALLAPLRFGSGIKIKVLDAIARGVPVVGTDIAFEGIPVQRAGRGVPALGPDGCAVDSDIRSWAPLLVHLAHPEVNEAASRRARAFAEQTYAKAVVYEQYDELLGAQREMIGVAVDPLGGHIDLRRDVEARRRP